MSSLASDPRTSITFFFFFFNFGFIYLFMAVLGLRFCARAFSSCGKWGPLFIAVRGPLINRGLLLRSTGSRCTGSVVVAHGPSCSEACGIFPDQGSNPFSLHWQADSQPLRHQGSPSITLVLLKSIKLPSVRQALYTIAFLSTLSELCSN